jgi:transcriptional regulator with XRE-family HTH domain
MNDTKNPAAVAIEFSGRPCSKASGMRVSASEARTAPPAKASGKARCSSGNRANTPRPKTTAAVLLTAASVGVANTPLCVYTTRHTTRERGLEELRRMREEAGFTQVGLAKASGVDRATINKIEQGHRSPTIETLEKLAGALGNEMADFFPKAQAPLPLDVPAGGAGSLELSLTDVMADLQRTAARHEGFLAVRQALDGFCEAWEKRIAEGDFDEAAIEEAGRTIKFFWPAVTAAADAEMVDGMRFGPYEQAAEHSKLYPAIRRFQALCDTVNSTYREKFLNAAASNVYPFPQRKAS